MITIIFGAGASHGSGKCFPYAPPLGDRGIFDELVKLNGAFARLSESEKAAFIRDGFEAGMASIENDSSVINPLQKEIACYLSGFETCHQNAYTRLFARLKGFSGKFSIATLNYDLLIEQSLNWNGIPYDLELGGRHQLLLKLHGSSNFLPNISGRMFINCGVVGGKEFVSGSGVRLAKDQTEVRWWCEKEAGTLLSPVMAMYAKDKRVVVSAETIEAIQAEYRKILDISSHIVIVGMKFVAHDVHVWGPLESANAKFLLVDPFPQTTINWAIRSGCADRMQVLESGFEEGVTTIARYVRAAALETR